MVNDFYVSLFSLILISFSYSEGLESLKSNEKIAIRTKGNPMPFVVALCRMSYEAILVNRMKGQISETMHFFGDILSHKLVIEKHITRGSLLCPNSGFNGNSLVIGSILGNSDDSEDENDDEIVEDDACLSDPETTSQSNEDDMQHVSIEMKNSLVLNSDTKALENKFSDLCENESNMLSSVDDIILRSIFLTFKYLINPNSLPILFSQFWMYAQRYIFIDWYFFALCYYYSQLLCAICYFRCAQSDSLCSRSLVRFSQSREDRSSDSNPDNHSEKHMEGEDVLPVVDIKMSSFKKVSTLMMYLKELQVLTISSEGDKISSFNASHSSLASLKIDDVEGFRNRFFDILSHDNSIGMGSLTLSTLKMASQYAKQHAWSDNESIFRQIQINKVYSLPSNYNFMYPSVEEWNDDPSFENMKYAAVHHSKLLFTASQLKEVISHYLHHAQTSSSNLASNSSAASLSPAITPTCRCASIVEQPSDKSKLRIFPEDPFYRIVRKFLATENNRKASKNKADKSQRPTNISQIEESERHQDDLDGGFTPLPPPEVESSSSYQCVGGVMLSSLKQSNQWREQQDQEEQRRKDIILASASNSSQLPSTKKEWKPYVLSSSSSSSSSSSFSSSANAATAWPSLSTAKSREPLDAECRKTGARTVTTTAWKESTTSQSSAKNKTNTSICCSNNGNDSLPENDYLEVSKNFLYQEIQGSCTTYYLVASNGRFGSWDLWILGSIHMSSYPLFYSILFHFILFCYVYILIFISICSL